MKNNKKILSLFLVFSLVLSLFVFPESAQSVTTERAFKTEAVTTDTVRITGLATGYTSLSMISIPSTIDGKTVTEIGASAFTSNTSIYAVIIPTGVTTIGNYAFKGCVNLQSISVPTTVTSIGTDAFLNTSYYSNLLEYSSNTEGVLYVNTIAIGYDSNYGSNVNLRTGTTSFGTIFANNTNISSITLPNTITNIKEFAFTGCRNLNYIIIPDSVTTIEDGAFVGCNVNVFTICCNTSSAAETYAKAWGYKYTYIPVSPMLYNSSLTFDKYKNTDIKVQLSKGSLFKEISGFSGMTLTSYYSGSKTSTIEKSISVSLDSALTSANSSYYNYYLLVPATELSSLDTGTYYGYVLTDTNEKLYITLKITDTTPTGTKVSIENQIDTFDLSSPEVITFKANLGTLQSKATDVTIYLNGSTVSTSNYSVSTTASTITFNSSYLSTFKSGQTLKFDVLFNDVYKTKVTSCLSITIKDSVNDEIKSTSLTLNTNYKTLTVGGTYQLYKYISPSNTTNKAVTWSSSDTSVATVYNGKVTARGKGTATITVTDAYGRTAKATIKVWKAPYVKTTTITLKKGSSKNIYIYNQLNMSSYSFTSSNKGIITNSLKTYENTYSEECIKRVITGKKVGTTTITWKVKQCNKVYTLKIIVKVI